MKILITVYFLFVYLYIGDVIYCNISTLYLIIFVQIISAHFYLCAELNYTGIFAWKILDMI